MPTEFYVSPQGRDSHPGTQARPFATPARARDALRGLPADERAGSTVWLAGGDYACSDTLTLTAKDSGRPDAPVTWRSLPGQRARLVGGIVTSGFTPVRDPAVRQRLPAAARDKVRQLDLKALGVTSLTPMRSRGFGRPITPAHVELFVDGEAMTLARWPNATAPEPHARIAGFPEGEGSDDGHGSQLGRLEGGFHYEGDRPRGWAASDDIWVHGYWAYDWANSYERIAALDLESRHIRTHAPHGLYGIRPGQRIYFLNVLEELDEPGEYYVDRRAGILYLWPPRSLRGAEVMLSLLEAPLVTLRRARHVVLRDLVLTATRGHGVTITGGADCLVAGCTIHNTGNYGVWIDGGADHGVQACDIHDTGDGGVSLSGGDRKKLEPCRHFVHNCHFHHQARWSRCYVPAVLMSGVGTRVSNNHIHDHPHCPILFTGNGHVVEYNDIHHVCHETGDVGGIYTGRDWTFRDNRIRFNHLHDIHGPGSLGSMAVYLDDCVSGITVFGNIFERTQLAAFIGGGRDCVVENNLFIDTHPAVQIDGRGLCPREVWQDMVNVTMRQRLLEMDHHNPPYATRYPELLEIDRWLAAGKGVPPEGNRVTRNIFVSGEWLTIHWEARAELVDVRDNWLVPDRGIGDPGFVDPEHPEKAAYALRDDAPALRAIGFQHLPVERIGLCVDEDPSLDPRAGPQPPLPSQEDPTMKCWIFTHNGAPLEYWMEGYKERFDAWHDGGVRGIAVGYMRFAEGEACWQPNPKVYERFGEAPPAAAPWDADKGRKLQAMLDDAAGRGWQVMIFGGPVTPAACQDQADAFPQVEGFIMDGPGENHYELAFHHHGELLEVRPGEETRFAAVGADIDRVHRGIDSLRAALHRLTPDRVRYLARGGLFAGLGLFDIDEDTLYWLRQRRASSRHIWGAAREAIDAVDRRMLLGGIPRTAAFSSLTGQDYQQMGQVYDLLFPKHYYWHRGFDGLYGTVARWVQRLQRWNPSLTEADAFLCVESLFGIRLPGVRSLLDLELGFPPEFYEEVVVAESRRALEAVGDPDKVIFWVSTGRSPHAGDPMTAGDLHRILEASRQAGARRFLYHPDPKPGAPEWRVISSLCGTTWEEDLRRGGWWPGDTARETFSGSRQVPDED